MKKKNPFPGQLPENYSLDQGKIQIFNPAGKKSATGLLTESNGVFHIDFFQSTYNDEYLQRKVRRDFGLERGTLQVTFSCRARVVKLHSAMILSTRVLVK